MAEAHDAASHRRLFAEAVEDLQRLQAQHGRKLLWGTANLFSHPRYAAGAATSPDPEVFAWAALQVRDALDATHRLGGANYVLWGGREGYETLLNTNLRRELDTPYGPGSSGSARSSVCRASRRAPSAPG